MSIYDNQIITPISIAINEFPIKKSGRAKWFIDYVTQLLKICEHVDYTLLGYIGEWKGNKTKLALICNKHNNILTNTSINTFLKGNYGCQSCRIIKIKSILLKPYEYYLSKILNICKEKNYICVGYIGLWIGDRNKLKLTCIYHKLSWYSTTINGLFSGNGCPECRIDSIRNSHITTIDYYINDILNQCNIKHYTYIQYINEFNGQYTKLHLFCNICKIEWLTTTIGNFLNGHGCPNCARSGFNSSKLAQFYLLKIQNESTNELFVGYGISNNPKIRLQTHKINCKIEGYKIVDCIIYHPIDGDKILSLENNIKKLFVSPKLNILGFKRESAYIKDYFIIKSLIENYYEQFAELYNDNNFLVTESDN